MILLCSPKYLFPVFLRLTGSLWHSEDQRKQERKRFKIKCHAALIVVDKLVFKLLRSYQQED